MGTKVQYFTLKNKKSKKKNDYDAKKMAAEGGFSTAIVEYQIVVRRLIFVVAQVNGIIDFLAGGVEAGDEHHLVAVAAAHNLVIDVFHVIA